MPFDKKLEKDLRKKKKDDEVADLSYPDIPSTAPEALTKFAAEPLPQEFIVPSTQTGTTSDVNAPIFSQTGESVELKVEDPSGPPGAEPRTEPRAPAAVTPEVDTRTSQEMQSLINTHQKNKEGVVNLYSNDPANFEKMVNDADIKLQDELIAAQAAYRTSRDRVASKELWQTIINGIGHMVAGVVGHQTGLNLGGLEFDEKSWEEEKQTLLSELRERRQDAYRKMTADLRDIAQKRADRANKFNIDNNSLNEALRNNLSIVTAKAKERADAKRDLKTLADATKDAQKELRNKIKEAGKLDFHEYKQIQKRFNKDIEAFKEDPNEDTMAAIQSTRKKYNRLAEKIGAELLPEIPKSRTIDYFLFETTGVAEVADVLEALAGTYEPTQVEPNTVLMITPDGKTIKVPLQDVEEAESRGARRK